MAYTPAPGEYRYGNNGTTKYSGKVGTGCITPWVIKCGIHAETNSNIEDIMNAIGVTDWDDVLNNTFWGGDGKNCILSLRYYPGLYHWMRNSLGALHYIKAGNKTLTHKKGGTEQTVYANPMNFPQIQWFTRPLTVPDVSANLIYPNTSSPRSIGGYSEKYIDYMCSYKLFLPYYGFLDIDPSDAVDHTIQIFYNIDLCTGCCTIDVVCKRLTPDNNGDLGGDEINYSVTCQVGEDIPWSADAIQNMTLSTWVGLGRSVINTAAAVATKGLSLAFTSNNLSIGNQMDTIRESASGSKMPVSALSAAETVAGNTIDENNMASRTVSNKITSTVKKSTDLMPEPMTGSPQRSSATSPAFAHTGVLFPFLSIEVPVSAGTLDYATYFGMPASKSVQLNTCHGFTQIAAVKPVAVNNTPKYFDEIVALLQEGVYFI